MNQNKKIIGLTGTIASGKSTAANYFARRYHITVIDADKVGHEVLADKTVIENLAGIFGTGICDEEGQIDRGRLGKIVFSDAEKLKKLNEVTHPVIGRRIRERIRQEQKKGDGSSFLIVEAIELLRSDLKDLVDEIWVVYADPDIRRRRMIIERNLAEEAACARIESQWDDAEYRLRADRIFDGNGSKEDLWRQCDAVYYETAACVSEK